MGLRGAVVGRHGWRCFERGPLKDTMIEKSILTPSFWRENMRKMLPAGKFGAWSVPVPVQVVA